MDNLNSSNNVGIIPDTSRDNQKCFNRVGYAFVPEQKLNRVYQPKKALAEGTIFPELNILASEYRRGI